MRIRRKLLLLLIGFSLGAAILIDLVGNAVLRSSLREVAAERLEMESALLADTLAVILESGRIGVPGAEGDSSTARSPAPMDDWIDHLGNDLRLRVTLIDPNGVVLGDSEVPASQIGSIENHLDRPEIQDAMARGSGRSRRHSATLGAEMSYFARRVDGRRGPLGFVRLAVATRALEAGGETLRASIALMSILTFAILGGIAYALTRRLSKPLESIAASADLVASGRYDAAIVAGGSGAEVDALARSLDRMRRALLDQIRALEEERRLLDTVVTGMREGLLAVDTNRRVILGNASLRRDLGLGQASLEGRPLAEVIRDPGVGEAFSRALADHAESRVGVTVRFPVERSFELLVAPLDSPDGRRVGAIGLFLDVTRLQALERMRREFIADVSHELRTPVASLKAAAENLLGPAGRHEEDRIPFLAIIRRNAERMEALLDDLTDLSLIETGAITLETERVELNEMVGDVVATLSGRAAAKDVALIPEVPPGLAVRGDRRRLDQILVNVLENAIKFNREGGSVWIRAAAESAEIVVTVEDTGPGIPTPDLEKIFQRFYRRDASRSREAGGTGLGLAIVKHLMRLHGGSVCAESRAGGGARIVMRFPADPAQS